MGEWELHRVCWWGCCGRGDEEGEDGEREDVVERIGDRARRVGRVPLGSDLASAERYMGATFFVWCV